MMKARELGITVEEKSPATRDILAKIKKLEKDGYEFEAATHPSSSSFGAPFKKSPLLSKSTRIR